MIGTFTAPPRLAGATWALLAAWLLISGSAAAGQSFQSSPDAFAGEIPPLTLEGAAELERNAHAALYARLPSWSVEKIRELARNVESMPPAVASRTLWMSVTIIGGYDASQIFAAALASRFPDIRVQSADILTSLHSPDTLRMLLARLFQAESDDSVLLHAIEGMAAKPFPESVRNLMEVMDMARSPQAPEVEAAAAHLRRLTRANLPSTPMAWRDWWLSHSRDYQD